VMVVLNKYNKVYYIYIFSILFKAIQG
jgi:hypothetical protein